MSPDIGGLTAHFLRAVDPAEMVTHVERVSERDRYQASRGIEEAAALVAEAAQAAGLDDVALDRFPADGRTHWWSFRAPRSWTPIRARLEVGGSDPRAVVIDHGRQPFSVATHSAGTPPDGIAARLVVVHDAGGLELVSGAIAIVPRASFTGGALEARLARAGALGFATDGPCGLDATGREQPGRIELEPDTGLFAFSVTSHQVRLLEGWADEGATARVTIELERTAAMPVVTGTLEGRTGEREVWMTAHLCHPRPSANDNASGVAALIGVAAAHASSRASDRTWGTDRTIRFVWAPEFVGTAAALHSHVRLGGDAVPSAAINLDMVGEDQASCGGPFLVERDPGCRPSLITPVADQVVGRVFASTCSSPGHVVPGAVRRRLGPCGLRRSMAPAQSSPASRSRPLRPHGRRLDRQGVADRDDPRGGLRGRHRLCRCGRPPSAAISAAQSAVVVGSDRARARGSCTTKIRPRPRGSVEPRTGGSLLRGGQRAATARG